MFEIGKYYRIFLEENVEIVGKIYGRNGNFIEVETEELAPKVNNNYSSLRIKVPVIVSINESKIIQFYECQQEANEYFYTTLDDVYTGDKIAVSVILTSYQRANFKGKLFKTEEECLDFIKENKDE